MITGEREKFFRKLELSIPVLTFLLGGSLVYSIDHPKLSNTNIAAEAAEDICKTGTPFDETTAKQEGDIQQNGTEGYWGIYRDISDDPTIPRMVMTVTTVNGEESSEIKVRTHMPQQGEIKEATLPLAKLQVTKCDDIFVYKASISSIIKP